MQRRYIILISLCLLLACQTSRDALVQNFAFVYRKNANPFRPELYVYHYKDDSTAVYLRFSTSEFESKKENSIPVVSYYYSYQVFNSIDENKLLDSLTFPINKVNRGETVSQKISLKLGKGTYFLQLKICDIFKKTIYSYYENIDKSDDQRRQFFLVKQQNEILYSRAITSNAPLVLEHSPSPMGSFYIKYFNRKFPIADPPFALDKPASFNYTADSLFTIKDIHTDSLHLDKEGFYHIQQDINSKEGLTLFRFYDEFPNIVSSKQLLEPLRYLTTRKEYDELSAAANPRQAVDKFWLGLGDNPDRTRELIRKYYSRVVEANKLFSSYKEGWKSDRGMIYIVYGAPNVVYRTSNSESWVYGDETSYLSTNFTFVKVTNPFTDNDFSLDRAALYQANWYSAIDIWRNGRALNEN